MFLKSKVKNRVFAALIMMVFLSGLTWGQGIKAPEISFDENNYSAGEVIEGAVISHTYTVYNRGNDMLRIQKVSAG